MPLHRLRRHLPLARGGAGGVTRAHSPADLDQALELLRLEPDLVPVAGCTDLMVAEPEWRADLPGVIDLLGISELRGIEARGDGLEIGATTTFTELRRSSLTPSPWFVNICGLLLRLFACHLPNPTS